MTEQKFTDYADAIYYEIEMGRLKKRMSYKELANLIGEGQQQLSRAIHGDMQPKSKRIREKVYKVLDIKE